MRQARSFGLILAILAALLVLPGCWVMSVYPLYQADERQPVDPGLAGQWWQAEGDCRLSITVGQKFTGEQEFALEYSVPAKGAEGAHDACVVDDGQDAIKLRGRLVDLQGHLFLDVMPAEVHDDFQVMPVHSIFRIAVRNEELDIVPLNPDFVEKAAREEKIQAMDEDPVITAKTDEWRKFVLSVADDVSAFPEVVRDRRLWHFTRMPVGLPPRATKVKPACSE